MSLNRKQKRILLLTLISFVIVIGFTDEWISIFGGPTHYLIKWYGVSIGSEENNIVSFYKSYVLLMILAVGFFFVLKVRDKKS